MLVLASFFPPTPFFFFLDACKCERYGKKGKLVEENREGKKYKWPRGKMCCDMKVFLLNILCQNQ